eukprot:jgi/Psemu1/515/gm1.515_g
MADSRNNNANAGAGSQSGTAPDTTNSGSKWKPQRGGKKRGGQSPGTPSQKFKGRCDDLEGRIFDIGPIQAARIIKTKNKLTQYAGQTYGANIRKAIDSLECVEAAIMTEEPGDPAEELSEIKMIMEKEKA